MRVFAASLKLKYSKWTCCTVCLILKGAWGATRLTFLYFCTPHTWFQIQVFCEALALLILEEGMAYEQITPFCTTLTRLADSQSGHAPRILVFNKLSHAVLTLEGGAGQPSAINSLGNYLLFSPASHATYP